jgi:hypothetical protein
MSEIQRMLGSEHEQDLLHEAERLHAGAKLMSSRPRKRKWLRSLLRRAEASPRKPLPSPRADEL